MKETNPSRHPRSGRDLKASLQAGPDERYRPLTATLGPAGEAPNDGAEEDAAAAWLAHVRAGRIG